MLNHQYFPQNMINGQILQANGMASVSNIKLAPNSSALVADSTQPIIYRCVADSLGNVTVSAFDISEHKSEEQIKAETLENRIVALETHLTEIEDILRGNVVSA